MYLVARQATEADLPVMLRLCRPEAADDPSVCEIAKREWHALWRAMRPVGIVLENMDAPPERRALGLMMTVFLTDEQAQVCVQSDVPYVLSRIAERTVEGDWSGLSDIEIARANRGDGLALLVCYIGWDGDDPGEEPAPNLRARVVSAYTDRYGGNRLRMMFGELRAPLLPVALGYGCRILNDYAAWAERAGVVDSPNRPFLVGIEREEGLKTNNFWFERMFTYFPPRFFFTESQRTILNLAREGMTDAEIAATLDTSADAIKKRWGGIYERVTEVFPKLLPERNSGARGAEKRRALLTHLRERLEELHPHEKP